MATGLRSTTGIGAPPYTGPGYTWDKPITFSDDITVDADLICSGTFTIGAVSADSLAVEGALTTGSSGASTNDDVTFWAHTAGVYWKLDEASDAIEETTAHDFQGNVTASAGNPDFDLSGSSGTFLTPTGAITVGGATTFSSTADFNDNVTASTGNPDIDFSGSSGAFLTSTGAVTVGGAATFSSTADFNDAVTASTGNPDFDLSASSGTFLTPTGAVTVGGATTFSSTADFNGNVTASAGNPNFDLSASSGTFDTPTGTTTIGADLVLTGHIDGQEIVANAFNFPAPGVDWTPQLEGAHLAQNLAAKKCWIPLNFLKIGDEIVSYKLTGDATEAAALTLDCKLVRINLADPLTTTDVAGGAITQIDADGDFDSEATLGAAETVATDHMYVLELLGTTGAGDSITVMGAEVKVNRKG